MLRSLLFVVAMVPSLVIQAEVMRVGDLDVDKVWVTGDVEVEISQGQQAELLLRGDSEDLHKQPFYTRDGALVLGASREHKRADFSDVNVDGSSTIHSRTVPARAVPSYAVATPGTTRPFELPNHDEPDVAVSRGRMRNSTV